MNCDIPDYTLSTLHVSSGYVGTVFKNWRVKRIEAPEYCVSYFSLRNNFWLNFWSCCLFIGSCDGEALKMLNWKSVDSSEFHFGKWWQPRCYQTQIRLRQKLGVGQWITKGSMTVMTVSQRNKDRLRQSKHRHRGMSFSSAGDPLLFPWVSVSQGMKQKFKTRIILQKIQTDLKYGEKSTKNPQILYTDWFKRSLGGQQNI